MADIGVGTMVEAGLDPLSPAYGSAAAGDTIPGNDGTIFLHVKNGNASASVVTAVAVQTSRKEEGFGTLARGDIVVSVPGSGGERFIGPFPPRAFNDANGKVAINYSLTTTVTRKAFKMPKV